MGGEVYYNLGDHRQAKQCFEEAISNCGENSISLRNLSVVLRAIDNSNEDGANLEDSAASRSANYAKALEHSKKAVALDSEDPQNWEVLGNTYMGVFFMNSHCPNGIQRALIAYEKAEGAYEKLGRRNFTLHLNRGKAAKFVEDYNLAIQSFQKANEICANVAADNVQKILNLVQRISTYVARKGDLKGKHLKEILSDFPRRPESRRLTEFQKGENDGLPILAKVVIAIDRHDEMPIIMICCDAAGDFFALSLYNAEPKLVYSAVIPMRSMLRFQRSQYRWISVAAEGGVVWAYPCVVISNPSDVVVVGGGHLGCTAVKSVLVSISAEQSPGICASPKKTVSCTK